MGKPASNLRTEIVHLLMSCEDKLHLEDVVEGAADQILSLLAQEVNRVIGEDEPDDGFTDNETVVEDGLVKVFRQVRNNLRAEQRRKAGLV